MKATRSFGPGRVDPAQVASVPAGLPRTALPIRAGVPCHLGAHLLRLEAGAAALGREVPWLAQIRTELEGWLEAEARGGGEAALRLVLHPDAALLSALLEPLPAVPRPYRLKALPHPLGAQREEALLLHKGLAGPWSQAVLAEARQAGAEDALLLWPDGTLAETAIAAVGLERDGVLAMPPAQGRVASLAERLDLPAWARERGFRIEVAARSLPALRDGRLWCMNALRGIWPAELA